MLRTTLRAAILAAALTFAVPVAAQAAISLPLVGWWPMNEGSGQTVKDWSGKGNNGVLGATTAVEPNDPSWVPGVFQHQQYFTDSALRFDAVDDFITIPDSSTLEPKQLTVGAWVRNDWNPGVYKYVISKNALDCQHSSYGLSTGPDAGIGFYIADGTKKY